MNRPEHTFFGLVAVQGLHSVEEYFGRLWEVFPPAVFLTGLVSDNRRLGFIVLNVGLFVFGLWSFVFPVRRHWPSARGIMVAWVVLGLINGLAHPLWSAAQAGYTPGVITAPILLLLAVILARQLRHASRTTWSA